MADVGILLYDDVELLDCCGPFEVFTTASRVALRQGAVAAPFSLCTIAGEDRPVTTRGGLRLLPSHTLVEHPVIDILVVPGGVTAQAESDQRLMAWLRGAAKDAAVTASVCTGAFLLAMAGILDGRQATSHWEDVDELERRFPAIKVRRNLRWVDNGPVVSSAGISAGIDMSLHLVRRQEGEALALATAAQMEYDWTPNPDRSAPGSSGRGTATAGRGS